MQTILALYRRVVELLRRSDWVPILLARLSIGLEFFLSGKGKLGKLDELTAYFATLGIPAPGLNATVTATTECVCGLLLVLGLATRLAAAPLVVVMIVAILTAQLKTLKDPFLSNFLYLAEWSFVVILVWLVFAGGGKVSLDHLIASRRRAAGAAGPSEGS
jgi:putative oxidoreductase